MATSPVTAEFAQTEVSSLRTQAAYHKRQARKHRDAARDAAREADRLERMHARLEIEHVIVPHAHSQEAQSNEHHDHTGT